MNKIRRLHWQWNEPSNEGVRIFTYIIGTLSMLTLDVYLLVSGLSVLLG